MRVKVRIVYKCGHVGIENLKGNFTVKQKKKQSYLLGLKLCEQCWINEQILKDEKFIKEVESAFPHPVPELDGSDKQILWAQRIRAFTLKSIMDFISETREAMRTIPLKDQFYCSQVIHQNLEASEALLYETDAKFWIETRHLSYQQLLQKKIKEYNLA